MMTAAQTAYFRLLGSLLYNEPSAGTIHMLKNDGIFAELPFAADNTTAAEGKKLMSAWLDGAPADKLTDEARSDFMRLFIGPGKVLAAPWGSVYMSVDKLIFTEETLRVRKYYEANGRIVKEKNREPDDHIGLELEFIADLLDSDNFNMACEFAEKLVLPWILDWNSDVQKYAKTGYYQGLANMAAGGVQALTGKE